jgi:hypothetical protein
MEAISTVRLPVVQHDSTIGEAFQRLRDAGTSALVVVDDRGPVVLTDWSLHNSLVAAGGKNDTLMSVATTGAYAPRSGILGLFKRAARPLLAAAQDDYVVTDIGKDFATVMTDPRRARELMQASDVVIV